MISLHGIRYVNHKVDDKVQINQEIRIFMNFSQKSQEVSMRMIFNYMY